MSTIGPNTRPLDGAPPRLKTPPGAIDCHMHFYLEGFAGEPGGPPVSEWATVEDYAVVQKRLGLDRVMITQSNAYQFNNGSTLAALDRIGKAKARATIAVDPAISDAELQALSDRGVCGARIMNIGPGATPIARMKPVEEKIRPFGWHLMVQFNGREIDEHYPALDAIECRYIIDHGAKFMDPVQADDPRVDTVLRLIDKGNAWFKIAGIYETSLAGGPDFADVAPVIRRVVAHAPERILWGSNWPHVGVPRSRYPDDAMLLDNLIAWAGESGRKKILVDNPAELFGFA